MAAAAPESCIDFLTRSENPTADSSAIASTSDITGSSRNSRPRGLPWSRDSRDVDDQEDVEEEEEEDSPGWKMSWQLEVMMKEVLGIYLRNMRYHPERCCKLSKDICEVIKDQAKKTVQASTTERYRLVVQVVIGQDDVDGTVQLATRCLCNQNVDICVNAIYRNKSLYAMSVVCAFYTES